MACRRYALPTFPATSTASVRSTMTDDAISRLAQTPRQDLRDLTPARVSLPTTGHSIATEEVLNFQLAHAQARDAVHATLHLPSFAQRLTTELPILAEASIAVLQLRSNAPD